MKRLKLLLLTLVITISTVIYAEKSGRIFDLNGLSAEIELLLRDSEFIIQEGKSVTVFFSIDDEKTIQVIKVAASDNKVSQLLESELIGQKLDGEKWREGMIYELSIHGKSSLACMTY